MTRHQKMAIETWLHVIKRDRSIAQRSGSGQAWCGALYFQQEMADDGVNVRSYKTFHTSISPSS